MTGRVENIVPILNVRDLGASVKYYVQALGLSCASWGGDSFTLVSRDDHGTYLAGTWVWIGVEDVVALHRELADNGAICRSSRFSIELKGMPKKSPARILR